MSEPTSLMPISQQVVALSGTSAQSVALSTGNLGAAGTWSRVRVVSTVDAWVAFGTNPTAVAASGTASIYMPAGVVEYFNLLDTYKIAGILASGTGTLSIAVCA